MAVDAVLFDLFGTLVPPYLRDPHREALTEVAVVLGMTSDEVLDGWTRTWDARATGCFASISDNLREIAPQASSEQLADAHRAYRHFTVQSLVPKPGAIDLLDWLDARGIGTGLVTNCAPDVPELWADTRWSYRFQTAVFSCTFGAKKPDPGIYRAALDELGVEPDRAVFVGDGSDRELEGAAAVGIRPVLVRNEPGSADAGEGGPSVAVALIDHLSDLRSVIDDL